MACSPEIPFMLKCLIELASMLIAPVTLDAGTRLAGISGPDTGWPLIEGTGGGWLDAFLPDERYEVVLSPKVNMDPQGPGLDEGPAGALCVTPDLQLVLFHCQICHSSGARCGAVEGSAKYAIRHVDVHYLHKLSRASKPGRAYLSPSQKRDARTCRAPSGPVKNSTPSPCCWSLANVAPNLNGVNIVLGEEQPDKRDGEGRGERQPEGNLKT
ncbi:hypothetical protein RUM44_002643 [Polyplax serrata]|uniref:Uncharacterized protein n=1 Tax=Polyplax serrata TaxID=468196 RepID=A0ABR1AGV1_POLSC